jgi:hypothetical protein
MRFSKTPALNLLKSNIFAGAVTSRILVKVSMLLRSMPMKIAASHARIVSPSRATVQDRPSSGPRSAQRPSDTGDRRRRCDRAADTPPRPVASGLEDLRWDGTPVPAPARVVAAARAFAAGNGYLPGQIVDRSA